MSTPIPTPTGDDLAGLSWFNGLTDGERAHWLQQAGSAVPADAWTAFKRVRAGLPAAVPPRAGRPPKAAEARLIGVSLRMTEAQRDKLRLIGGVEALRRWIDSHPS
jgi:hypothetical protein